jgi:acyl-coenzyme A synthetase/AMP-(fatty) acid ligase
VSGQGGGAISGGGGGGLYDAGQGIGAPINTPLAFDATVTSLFLPLIAGGCVIALPRERQIEALAELLAGDEDLTLVKLTPAHLEALRVLFERRKAAIRTKVFVVGGEALNPGLVEFWRTYAPDTRIVNEYGPTETVVGTCVHDVSGDSGGAADVPIGRPTPNTRMYVLDAGLEPAAIGVTGELYIAGDQLGSHYLNRRSLTAERFVADPYGRVAGGRMYRTGDLAHWDGDGVLHCHGRADQQVKIRGFRIEPAEIEAALTEDARVARAAVVVRMDDRRGRRLVAYLVLSGVAAVDPASLRSTLAVRLPDAMIPAAFVTVESLPLTPNGKVDRRALAALPDGVRDIDALDVPRGAVEQQLAAVWSGLLGVDAIGRHDNFFALGGHSLLAMRVPARVREALGVDLTMRDLFEARTLVDLAVIVQALLLRVGHEATTEADGEFEEVEL